MTDATNTESQPAAPASIEDVARSLVAPQEPPKREDNQVSGGNEAPPARDDSEEASADDDFDTLLSEATSDPNEAAEETASDDADASPDAEATDEDDFFSEEPTERRYNDDDEITVTVDGEEVKVPLKELKRRYAGEGAIEKRLQEATEARKVASEQARINREQMENIVKAVSSLLFTPTLQPPDPSLMQQDPTEYLLQKNAYQEEQQAIAQRRQGIDSVMKQLHQQADEALAELRKVESNTLKQKLPVLNDPVKGPKFRDAFVDMLLNDYGFTTEDLNNAVDHRLFLVAADALRFKMMQKKNKSGVKVQKTKAAVAPKRAAKPQSSAFRRQQQRAYERARETGKVEDVAETLLVRKRK